MDKRTFLWISSILCIINISNGYVIYRGNSVNRNGGGKNETSSPVFSSVEAKANDSLSELFVSEDMSEDVRNLTNDSKTVNSSIGDEYETSVNIPAMEKEFISDDGPGDVGMTPTAKFDKVIFVPLLDDEDGGDDDDDIDEDNYEDLRHTVLKPDDVRYPEYNLTSDEIADDSGDIAENDTIVEIGDFNYRELDEHLIVQEDGNSNSSGFENVDKKQHNESISLPGNRGDSNYYEVTTDTNGEEAGFIDTLGNYSKETVVEDQIKKPNVCLSQHCYDLSKSIKELLNTSADPCDDFYQFACGNWEDKHPIKPGANKVTRFTLEQGKLAENLKDVLTAPKLAHDGKAVKMAKEFYASCMDLDTIEARGAEPLKNWISELGGWPLLDDNDWDEKHIDIELVMAKLAAYRIRPLLQPSVSANVANPKENTLKLIHHSLSLQSHVFQKPKRLRAYGEYILETVRLLIPDLSPEKEERIIQDIKDLIIFERAVAATRAPDRSFIRDAFESFTIKTLQENTFGDWFDLKRYFNLVINQTSSRFDISDTEKIVVVGIKYLKKMIEVMKSTPKRTLVNYLVWRGVKPTLSELDGNFRNISKKFASKVLGSQDETFKWIYCVRKTNHLMPAAVGRLYIKENFKESSKKKVLEIVSYVKSSFIEGLDDVEWMDGPTKEHATQKVKAMKALMGYNDYILDDELLLNDYRNVEIDGKHYFENIQKLMVKKMERNFMKLRRSTDRSISIFLQPGNFNAHMVYVKNQLIFTAAILKPLFQKKNPNYMNYAAIGFTVGHELTHGFDDFGHRFDKDGKLSQWWDAKTTKYFRDKSGCIIHQYGNYTTDSGQKLNAVISNGENIADNGAIKLSYNAYQTWLKEHEEEQLLPELMYNQNQLFFLNYGQLWCSSYRDDYLGSMVISNPHSPGKFRVNGPLSNFPTFSETFNCPLGSPMNREDKCKVW